MERTEKSNTGQKQDNDDAAAAGDKTKPAEEQLVRENIPTLHAENDDRKEAAKSINLPGEESLGKNSVSVSERRMDEPEHKDSSSVVLATPTKAEITNNQDTNSSPSLSMSKYRTVLNDLNLKHNTKLTIQDARTVDKHTLNDDQLTSADQIPDYILKKLMIVNYHAREFKLELKTSDNDKTNNDESDESEDEDTVGINPMDALLAIFHCSDDFLRQDLAIKLSACQLSVPFLLPDPEAPSENVTILLSALENITKTWNGAFDNNEGAQQVFATEHPFPVVSFIRIDKITMSKSALINKVMSDTNGEHNHFFHKDMKGGDVERKIVDGLVELSWYLPGGSKKQTLKNEICFANLRGDAKDFKKQLNVLMKISSVLFLLLPSSYPDETLRAILENALGYRAKVILIFNENKQEYTQNYFNNLQKKHSKMLSIITRAKKANEHGFLQDIRQKIQKYISEVELMPLVKLELHATNHGIHLDGRQSYLKLGEIVDTWLGLGAKTSKELLKLQMHVPVLASLEREKYRPTRNIDEIYEDIEKEKKAQNESWKQLDGKISQCLNIIAAMDETERKYFLTKLKHQLDKMSMQVLAKLHQQYSAASLSLQKKKTKTRKDNSDALSIEKGFLKDLEESITKYSFGLEHIIRELAQLYELTDNCTNDYAGAAADMLLSGQPLELVDGDSLYIPLRWFNSVYTKVQQKTKNAKIFVISVLGIQSSGKSTMLNTMFGLEFPVSASKCTRGAFASLIPVNDSLNARSKFDYVLIIDTEGLTGSVDPDLREHDNELATFAIGVADVTIVNIFGENNNEIKEFLEIAVHAFLKMKLVEKKKSCKIVHQNVVATDAITKLDVNRSKLKKDLDKMAKLAATQENCEDNVQELNDIIQFNENDDVFYIPNLFQGSPPMAPVNPDYGRAVQKVKENIISLMCSSGSFQLPVSQFQERVENLWKAMLKENFIFSFRNTIEVRAFTSLDQKYFEEYVNLMVRGMGQLEREIEVALRRCTTRDERKKIWNESKMQIRKTGEELSGKMRKAMMRFFETNEDKGTLEQWKENVMNKIVQNKENQVMQVNKNCLATFNYLQDRQDVDERKERYEKKLLEKARVFITSAHDTKDVEKCKAEFQQEWQQWIEDVPATQETKTDVNNEMMLVLCNTHPQLNRYMTEKLGNESFRVLNFKEIAPVIDVSKLDLARFGKCEECFKEQFCLSAATTICEKAVDEGLDFAKEKSKSGVRCKNNDLKDMYHKVITTIMVETEKHGFKFIDSLKCDILIYIFASVYEIFDGMEERYLQERDIRGGLERNIRPTLEEYFLNICSDMVKEVSAATSIVHRLYKPIESELNRNISAAVADQLLKLSKYKSKGQLHASALIQLGEESNFKSYTSYLENPVKFLRNFLMESVENFCLNDENASITSILKNETKKIGDKMFAAISTASETLMNCERKKLTFWIEKFVESCSVLEITKEMFAVAAIQDDLTDIAVFQSTVRANVTQFLQSWVNSGIDRAAMKNWKPSPNDLLFDLIFGCQNLCPFCKALCDQTIEDHAGKHSTRIHRPQALGSYRYVHSQILGIEICTKDVDSTAKFQNSDTLGKLHPYKDYESVNDYYKSWSIPPDSSFEASKYWQWFMATFKKELAEHYNAKEPNIPETWKNRSFEEVADQLRQEYKL